MGGGGKHTCAVDAVPGDMPPSQMPTGRQGGRRTWDDRHHLLFGVINEKMQKNVRSYFDRPREPDNDGLRCEPPLRPIWQLDAPEIPNEQPSEPSSSKAVRSMQKS